MDTGLIQRLASPSHGMNLGPRTSLAKSINGDTYSTVQDFATISSLKELNE
jgi:hypothetical protein